MIEEAFPSPVVPNDSYEHPPMQPSATPRNSCVELCSPPAYTPPERLPRYIDGGSLAERLACPNMQEAFAIPVTYNRVPMIAPLPNHPYSTYHELMLLAPGMPFKRFLREVEEKAGAYILSERPSRRLMSKEKVVFIPVLKLNVGRGRFLRRSNIVKSAINAQNWSAVVAILQEKRTGAELKVKFWTERPGSAEETLRKERVACAYMNVESTISDVALGSGDYSTSSVEAVRTHI
ncbi:hypothetical protein Slin15195_G034370 [Septoria linicola]|uniref:Uncharacterized protein n=1 Tax=Septoria linicola TaxID=215465 RepID=A0A9Q9EI98_9PEZI|nr:hypothetical protein Slin15195_G034370 [Septoria linicola]